MNFKVVRETRTTEETTLPFLPLLPFFLTVPGSFSSIQEVSTLYPSCIHQAVGCLMDTCFILPHSSQVLMQVVQEAAVI
jgi:hypothetical protein